MAWVWGIWCKDQNDGEGDWLREPERRGELMKAQPVLACENRSDAEERAARYYGYKEFWMAQKEEGPTLVRRIHSHD
jgi:hypothetical protein